MNGGTLPPDVALTTSRPDLDVINRSCSPQQVTLAELTMTWDTTDNMNNAKSRKEARYEFLTEDIQQKGFKCNNLPFEIGVGDT